MTYADFLDRKTQLDGGSGFEPVWTPDFRQAVKNLNSLADASEEITWTELIPDDEWIDEPVPA